MRPSGKRPLAAYTGPRVQEMVIYGVSFDMVGKQPIVLLKTVDSNTVSYTHLTLPTICSV